MQIFDGAGTQYPRSFKGQVYTFGRSQYPGQVAQWVRVISRFATLAGSMTSGHTHDSANKCIEK